MSKKLDPDLLPRRHALSIIGGVAASVALGCSDDETDGKGGAGGGSSSNSTSGQGGGATNSSTSTGGGGMAPDFCADDSGYGPEELLAPIDTFVVLCMENRSFDHFLGSLKLLEGRNDLNGLVGNESNPAPGGGAVGVFKLDNFTPEDPPHSWDECHAQFNNGANDGFVTEHAGPSQHEAMGYHVRDQLPVLHALADASAITDAWYSSVMGPTWPNRFYLHGATSHGEKGNLPNTGFNSIFDYLDNAGLSHLNYYSDIPWCSGAYFKFGGLTGIENFFSNAAAGTLPRFSIIDPQFFGNGANDDHPDHDISLGQALIASVYQALAQSAHWGSCMLIITYDEHGGFYDHVPPPLTSDERPEFRQMGFRVPSLVCGPFAKRGCAVSTVFDHTSVIKTLMTRFSLPNINERTAAANDLSSCISPLYLRDPQAPARLPVVNVALDQIMTRQKRMEHHPEMAFMADRGHIPRHLDRRAEGNDIARRVLDWGERLGAVRIR